MKQQTKDLILQVSIAFIVFMIIAFAVVLVLDQLSPFKDCKDKPDDYVIQAWGENTTCGMLKAVNVTNSIT